MTTEELKELETAELIEALRGKKSRDNRALLDEAADRLEKLLDFEKCEVGDEVFVCRAGGKVSRYNITRVTHDAIGGWIYHGENVTDEIPTVNFRAEYIGKNVFVDK